MAEPLGRVAVDLEGSRPLVRILGEVDVSNAHVIESALETALDRRATDQVVDLSRLSYIDSAGIRIVFALATRLQARRQRLHLVVPLDGVVRRVVEIVDLARVAHIHDSLETLPPYAPGNS